MLSRLSSRVETVPGRLRQGGRGPGQSEPGLGLSELLSTVEVMKFSCFEGTVVLV